MVNGYSPLLSWIMLTSIVKSAVPAHSGQEDSRPNQDDSSITCYTCVNVSDNTMCNQYAIDRPCPKGEEFCHTLHIMDSTGASVVVNKKCADTTECWPLGVGCVIVDSQTICVSCCDEMYCNMTVPTNQSNAIFSAKRSHQKSTKAHRPAPENAVTAPNTAPTSSNSLITIAIITLLL